MRRINIILDRIQEMDRPLEEIFLLLQVDYKPEESLETLYNALVKIQDRTKIRIVQKNPVSEQLMQIVRCFQKSSVQNKNLDVKLCVA
ncbi:MAG: hypothetical protein SO150_04295 [Faecalicoccus sp.]|uniref:hypothetical protein n=1 Tax=Faecalicoccus sp. TaxID=1971758 RepID=UPI002A81F234|nr:hypothetical protein [Faecalicoccus sp.]MCI6378961.1 hypothetical protein [Erysipelotrichaceae bacterium]MDY4869549.1 hypothetical protein [Faecalicoccus sp.]